MAPLRLHPSCLALICAGMAVTACKDDSRPPTLEAIDDQVAAVGQELVINLRATDPDGDAIEFDFASELEAIDDRATIGIRPDGTGVFRFTPLGADVGTWPFDFTASDGTHTDTVTATIDIRTAVDGSAPLFRQPLGSGTTLDLGQLPCLDLQVVVEDQDDAAVTLGQADPVIEGATLMQSTGLTATWRWCPEGDQLSQDRHPLTLFADDGENPPVLKNYLIVLRAGNNPDCPGKGPSIEHEPQNVNSVLDVEITAEVSDDQGLKGAPLVYYTLEEPKLPIDFSELELVEMEQQSGDDMLGIWRARVPNPVAGSPDGTTVPLYYLISAADDDDAEGECDHITDLPDEGTFSINVTNPGGSGGAEPCAPCSADVQCGGDSDLCAPVGDGDNHCLSACDGGCDDGFECVEVTSVDGANAQQCRPARCGDVRPPVCEDDAREDNDTRAQAGVQGPLDPGVLEGLVACEGDEDWFQLQVGEQGTLGGLITANGSGSDLDLGLYDVGGSEVEVASTPSSDEIVEQCVMPGTYYLRVFSTESGNRDYDLLYDFEAENCSGQCEDDSNEQDDTSATATGVSLPYSANNRVICSGDPDYYAVDLSAGDTLVMDLTFTHADGDLDLHFHDTDGTDLTPCSIEDSSGCNLSSGQSATSNEHAERTIDTAGTYFVSVQGYGGDANDYDIDLTVE